MKGIHKYEKIKGHHRKWRKMEGNERNERQRNQNQWDETKGNERPWKEMKEIEKESEAMKSKLKWNEKKREKSRQHEFEWKKKGNERGWSRLKDEIDVLQRPSGHHLPVPSSACGLCRWFVEDRHLQVDAVMMTRWRLDVLMNDDRQMVMRMKLGRGNSAELLTCSSNSSGNIDKCFRWRQQLQYIHVTKCILWYMMYDIYFKRHGMHFEDLSLHQHHRIKHQLPKPPSQGWGWWSMWW